jgi:phage gp36-like protein
MANYCTQADIEINMRGVSFQASGTAISIAGLSNIIAEESALIDAHLQVRYELPIANATALLFLKRIAIALVVYRATNIIQPKQIKPIPNDNAEQEISHYSAYKDAMRFLREIQAGKMSLPLEDQASVPNFVSTAVTDADEATFVYHETQW